MNEQKNDTLPCAVVRDLLPLYHDGVVSAETRSAVGEHLMGCADCRREYEAMEKPLPEQAGESGSTLNRFRALMRRQKRKKIIAIVLAAVLAATAVLGGQALLIRYWPVDMEDCYEFKQVCRFETDRGSQFFILCKHCPGLLSMRHAEAGENGEMSTLAFDLTWSAPKQAHENARQPMQYDFWFVPAEGYGTLTFGGETVWQEDEDGDEDIPSYVYDLFFIREKTGQGMWLLTDDGVQVTFGIDEEWQVYDWEGNYLGTRLPSPDGSYGNFSFPVS